MSRRFLAEYPFLTLLLFWAMTVALTWGIVENPLYDFSAYLHAAERWADGDIVYRDFQWIYPPLTIWVCQTVMRIVPDSYAAVSFLSAAVALLMIVTNYLVARLLLRPQLAILSAIATYCATFVRSSVSGENLIGCGFTFLGFTLFPLFVCSVGRSLLTKHPGTIRYSLLIGALGGICLLSKHEQIAGVMALCVFLAIRRAFAGRQRHDLRLPAFFAAIVLVGAAGYAWTIHHSGWFYFWSAFTGYGTVAKHAMRSVPSLVTLWLQCILLVLHSAVLFAVAAWALHTARGPENRFRWRLTGAAVLCAVGGLFGAFLEARRVLRLAQGLDLRTALDIPNSLANFGMFSHDVNPLLASVHYMGGMFCLNVFPILLLGAGLGAIALARLVRLKRAARPVPCKLQVVLLLLFAVAGLQTRAQLTYSSYGTIELLLPVLFFLLPLSLRSMVSYSLCAQSARRLQSTYAVIVAVATLAGAAVLYAYEIGSARIRGIQVTTDKGPIWLPKTPANQAFADLVRFVRTNNLPNILPVPYDGIQYWTGRPAQPFWLGYLLPATYPLPWRDHLGAALSEGNLTFVQFNRLDTTTVTFPSATVDWIDGPHYTPYRWKEHFPAVWQAIQNDSRLLATFGPTEAPFFSVYQQFRPTTVQKVTGSITAKEVTTPQ